MVDVQLVRQGISDCRVLDAMRRVPREKFVPADWRHSAYEDNAVPIGCEQTISQPYTVAFMCESLQLSGDEKVLEIGTGSGYGAAVLSLLARSICTIERIPELADEARVRLTALGYNNVQVVTGDGTLGLPDEAPFDAVVVTAGAESIPEPLIQQLRVGGRVVIPIGGYQETLQMRRLTKFENEMRVEELGRFTFVPLIGESGAQLREPD